MQYRLVILLLVLPLFSMAQERGFGIRLGEPLSLTYKDFLDDYFSFEVMLGTAGVNGDSYFRRDFDNNPPASNAFYVGHRTENGASINIRGAYHEDITDMFGIEEGYILAYGGVGAQLRTTQVTYVYYLDQIGNGTPTLSDSRSNIDFGPEVFVGSEYYLDELPLSVFAEIGFFMELADRLGHVRGQGGIGVRYLF